MLNKSSIRCLLASNKKTKKISSVKNFSSLLMQNDNNDLATPSTSASNTRNRSVSAPTSPYKTIIARKFHESNFQVRLHTIE